MSHQAEPKVKAVFKAADAGDVAFFEALRADAVGNVGAVRDAEQCTALHRACRHGRVALVRFLVEELGLAVDDAVRAKTPLYEAACNGHAACAAELIRLGADVFRSKFNEWNPLHVACSKGFRDVAGTLLGAARDTGPDAVRGLLEARNKEGSTALALAAREGHADVVRDLLASGANANNKNHNNRTPLLSAISSGSLACVRALMESGQCSMEEGDVTDSSGANLFHEAASLDEPGVLHYLIETVPNCKELAARRDKAGRLPIHIAALNGKSACIRAFLNLVPQTRDESDDSHSTPLLLAAVRGHALACSTLLQFGADPEPCIEPARKWRRTEALGVLERRKVALKDKELIDMVGFGTYKLNDHTYEAVLHFLKKGGSVLDMAEFYGNETEVGRAIHDSGRNRDELFLISKVWNSNTSRGLSKQAVEGMLGRLGKVGHLDMVLIHWPCKGFESTFGDLIKCRESGLVRYIGASNFLPEHCERIYALYGEWPALNEIELSSFFFRKEQVDWFQSKGIAVMSYRSLGVEGFVHNTFKASLANPHVQTIATEVKRTPSQVLLRWCLQHGVLVIPKSKSTSRIGENMDLFDFNLSHEQMGVLDTLTQPDLEDAWMANVFKPSSEKDVE